MSPPMLLLLVLSLYVAVPCKAAPAPHKRVGFRLGFRGRFGGGIKGLDRPRAPRGVEFHHDKYESGKNDGENNHVELKPSEIPSKFDVNHDLNGGYGSIPLRIEEFFGAFGKLPGGIGGYPSVLLIFYGGHELLHGGHLGLPMMRQGRYQAGQEGFINGGHLLPLF
ncbi:hypothetical protein FHG87_004549 [Trinorchestia longiramus]|nr:hypothetical protein FHG87_004549 [Trinorchestia longiramus]